jgi:Domain of unknown function (DUF5602)
MRAFCLQAPLRALLLTSIVCLATACHGDDAAASDASLPNLTRDAAPEGTLFGANVSSYLTLANGVVSTVGVRIPMAAIEAAPADGPFREELILDMPASAKTQTFLSQLRVNWLAHGHGPGPYGIAHFDFHFFRGSRSEIDGIGCGGAADFPPEILTSDHALPDTCVTRMGYHAWPSADLLADATFTASLILGYVPSKLIFIEPMITQATLLAGRDFELAITPPQRSGGDRTLFPTRVRAQYQDGAVRLEFDAFVELD